MTDTPSLSSYVNVVGFGRSGTNMVLGVLDFHPDTICRNEVDGVFGTPFTGLGDKMFVSSEPDDFADRWAHTITLARNSVGDRDPHAKNKSYLRTNIVSKTWHGVMSRRKLRRLILPRVEGRTLEEWRRPAICVDREKFQAALPVFKLMAPAWAIRAHAPHPQQKVVHVIRNPHNFLQSWWGRYVGKIPGGPERVFADNQISVPRILSYFGQQNTSPPDFSTYELVVSELWRWRYLNETMSDALSSSSRYIQVYYEDAIADKAAFADTLFSFAGLAMSNDIRDQISGQRNTLFKPRSQDGLDPALVKDAVAHVLSDSGILRDRYL